MFLEGKRIRLREVTQDDILRNYYEWMNDPEVTRYLESRYWPQSIERIGEYIASMKPPDNIFLAITQRQYSDLSVVELPYTIHIGNIRLGTINWQHRFAEIGLVIGKKDLWGKGYGTEAISLVRDYAFSKLSLNKLTAGCYCNNPASIRAFERAGFVREGVLRSQYYFEYGEYVDEIVLGCIATEILTPPLAPHPDYIKAINNFSSYMSKVNT